WLCNFDQKITIKHNGQCTLLLLDNCGSHKIEGLDLSYPIDAEIIMSFKKHYCNYHIQWILEQVEAGQFIQDLKLNVLQQFVLLFQ
ncbi:11158_t:CDS:2, partial [Diversispora eburnea]